MNLVDSAKIFFLSLKVAGAGNRLMLFLCRLPAFGLIFEVLRRSFFFGSQ